jgi:stress response protein YsnF
VSDEMREKTIKCLMKVLDYQLKSAAEQAKDIKQHYHKTDAKLKEYEEMLKREENRITTEEIKAKIEMAKK